MPSGINSCWRVSKAEFCRVVPNNGNFPSLLVCTDLSTASPKKGQELVFSVLLHAFRALLCLLKLTRLALKTYFKPIICLSFNLTDFGLEIYPNDNTYQEFKSYLISHPHGNAHLCAIPFKSKIATKMTLSVHHAFSCTSCKLLHENIFVLTRTFLFSYNSTL